MVDVSDFEKENLAWGSRYMKTPWAEMVRIFNRMGNGEEIPLEERLLQLELFDFIKLDLKSAYNLVTFLLYDILKTPNGSMFTIILGEKGDRIIWASIEHEENGVYKEFIPLKHRLDEDWAKEAAKFIVAGKNDELLEYLQKWMSTQEDLKHIELGLIKMAGIQFFDEFRLAWENSKRGEDLGEMVAQIIDALKKIFDNDWICFEPEPEAISVMRILVKEKLDVNLHQMKHFILQMIPDLNMGVSILTKEWGTFLKITKKGERMEVDSNQDIADEVFLKNRSINKFTDKARKKFKARDAIGLDGEALKKLLVKILKAPMPWDMGKIDKGLAFVMPGVKEYKKFWFYSPEPIFMKGWVLWLMKRLGFDIDLSRFSDWWIGEVLLFGLLNMMGIQFKMLICILDENGHLETGMLINGDDGRLSKVQTFPEEQLNKYKEFFKKEDNPTEALNQVKFDLWKEHGWIKYGVGIKTSVVTELLKKVLNLRGIFVLFRALSFYRFLRKFIENEIHLAPPLPLKTVLKDIGLRDLMKVMKAAMGMFFDDPDVEYPNLEQSGLL